MSPKMEIRHQAAIAGLVTNATTSATVTGALIQISSAPAAFTDWLALRGLQYGSNWAAMTARPDRTVSGKGGVFHFLDLPDGAYTVSVSLPRAGSRYGTAQGKVSVARDAQGNITLATATIALPPTGLSGTVTGAGKPVTMAEVRVQSSGENTRSDAMGKYIFAGLETGNRSIQVLAQGFKPLIQTIKLGSAGSAPTLDFALTAA